ncbi:unnamed protein product, partial [Rotaria sp. Silwood2]
MLRRRRLIYFLCLIFINFLVFSHVDLSLLKKNEQKSKSIDYCLKKNVTPSEKFYSNIVYIPKLKVIYCDIPIAA